MDSNRKKPVLCKNNIFPLKNRLALITGDPKGVGFFITHQALKILGPQKNFQFLVWSDLKSETLKAPQFKTFVFKKSSLAFKQSFQEEHLIQIKSSGGPGAWLCSAGKKALKREVSALVTGPVSKISLKKYNVLGQTDLLKKLTGSKEVFMCFRGRFFNVLLLTDHIPLKQVSIQKNKLKKLLDIALSHRLFLSKNLQNKKIAVLGLNPHAGENGILGQEEQSLIPFLKNYPEAEGPLCPDSAFLRKNWKKYSFFISLYHDQGLIPFKLVHEQKAFAQSLGLPFLRFGVDHGTGLGLKKQDISHESFLMALKEAMKRIQKQKL